jgi:hypothetical protein
MRQETTYGPFREHSIIVCERCMGEFEAKAAFHVFGTLAIATLGRRAVRKRLVPACPVAAVHRL